MAKAFLPLLLVTLASVAVWQYVRIAQFEKDVYFHNSSDCKRVTPSSHISDLSRFGDVNLALSGSLASSLTPFLFSIHHLQRGAPIFRKVQIFSMPDQQIRPLGFHIRRNETAFILSQPADVAEVLVLSLIEDGPEVIKATYQGKFTIPKALSGKVTDLIAVEDDEIYLAQTYAVAGEDPIAKAKQLAYELLDVQDTYVHRCTYAWGKEADCRALNETREVSVTGIGMDKFGSYFVAYASVDTNWVGLYERKSNGNLSLKQKIFLRDRCQKLDYDVLQQRGYCGALPYPYSSTAGAVPGGAVELTSWDNRVYHTYRTMVMHNGTNYKGGSVVARNGRFMIMASVLEDDLLVCPIAAPFI